MIIHQKDYLNMDIKDQVELLQQQIEQEKKAREDLEFKLKNNAFIFGANIMTIPRENVIDGYRVKWGASYGLSANQLNISSATNTLIDLDTKIFEIADKNTFDTANHKFIVPENGYYFIVGKIYWYGGTVASKNYSVRIYKNGAALTRMDSWNATVANGQDLTLVSDGIEKLVKDDYIQLYGWHSDEVGTSDVNIDSTYLEIIYLGN